MTIISKNEFNAICDEYSFLKSVPKSKESKLTYYKYLEIMGVSWLLYKKIIFKHGAKSSFFPTPAEINGYLKPKIQRMSLEDVRNPQTEYHEKVREVLINDFDFYYPAEESYEFRTRTNQQEGEWRKDSQIKINCFFKEIELGHYDINNIMTKGVQAVEQNLKQLKEGKKDA